MAGIITDILKEAIKKDFAHLSVAEKTSREWFRQETEQRLKYLSEANVQGFIKGQKKTHRKVVIPGYMYTFIYDAKTKDELPYWDRYPLVFPIKIYKDGFLGINFHYLPHEWRAKLMDALYGLARYNEHDDMYQLRVTYDILNNAAKYKAFKPCLKRYLTNHVKSEYHLIEWPEWPIALFLPLAKFRKKTAFTSERVVHRDSVRMINSRKKT